MKHLICLSCMLALVGCDRSAEMNHSSGKGEDTASVNPSGAQTSTGAQSGDAQQELKAQAFQFGIYKAAKKGRVAESADTNTGKVVRRPVLEHVSMTDQIPLKKDTYFGFQYRLWNLPTEATVKRTMQLRSVLIHPEMSLPDGSKSTGWDRPVKGIVKSQQVIGFDGYAFNEDYELVEGDWIFQIWYQDQKLLERKFVAVPPQADKTAEAADTE